MTEYDGDKASAAEPSFSVLRGVVEDIGKRFEETDEIISSVREVVAAESSRTCVDAVSEIAVEERERDMMRFLRRIQKKDRGLTIRSDDCEKKISRGLLMLLKRREHIFYRLLAERDTEFYSFNTEKERHTRRACFIERELKHFKRSEKREVRCERLDGERYYSFLRGARALDVTPDKKERADYLCDRAEVLLARREELTERLISLYRGTTDAEDKSGTEQRVAEVRKKYGSSVYRSQKRIAARVGRMHAPRDLKDKIYTLMNKKTEYAATIEAARFRLYHTSVKGSAKRELIYTVRDLRRRIGHINSELKYLIKKADDHNEEYKEGRNWATLLIILTILLIFGVAAWYFYGDVIYEYVNGLLLG